MFVKVNSGKASEARKLKLSFKTEQKLEAKVCECICVCLGKRERERKKEVGVFGEGGALTGKTFQVKKTKQTRANYYTIQKNESKLLYRSRSRTNVYM